MGKSVVWPVLMVLAACGVPGTASDQVAGSDRDVVGTEQMTVDSTATSTTEQSISPVTSAPADRVADEATTSTEIDHPTESDERLVVVASSGGLGTPENDFMGLPTVTIMRDGNAILARERRFLEDGIEVFDQRTLSADGIQQVLQIASSNGLLESRDRSGYDDDGGARIVSVWAGGEQFINGAYGSYGEPDSNRDRIDQFVADLLEFVHSDDQRLGPITAYQPDHYDFFAQEIDEESLASYDPQDFIDWPEQSPLDLADAKACARVDAQVFGDALDSYDLPILIADGDTRYLLAARPALPGFEDGFGCPS